MKAILLSLLQTKQNEAKLLNTRLVQLADELKHLEQSLKISTDGGEVQETKTEAAPATEKPKAATKGKKEKAAPVTLDESEGEAAPADDLDAFLGEGPGEPAPKLKADDVRTAIKTLTSEKGQRGLEAARVIMAKFTPNGSAQIKDLPEKHFGKVIAELGKVK